jgi:hypothetical protein
MTNPHPGRPPERIQHHLMNMSLRMSRARSVTSKAIRRPGQDEGQRRASTRNSANVDQVANARTHATTRRVVAEHFAEERPAFQPLTTGALQAVLRLERRITRDGMVSTVRRCALFGTL